MKANDYTAMENQTGIKIAQRLRMLKKTQRWLAEQVDVSNSTVTKWIKTGQISTDKALKVAVVLEITLDELLNRSLSIPQSSTENTTSLSERTRLILQEMDGKEHGKQARLAEIAGCSWAVVNHWISGERREMRHADAERIAKALGYRVDWLMHGTGPERNAGQGAVTVEAAPFTPSGASPVKKEQPQPAQDRELLLVYVTFDELRLLTSYRRRAKREKKFDAIAKVIQDV